MISLHFLGGIQDSGSVKFLNNVVSTVVLPLSYALCKTFLRIAMKMFCSPPKKAIFSQLFLKPDRNFVTLHSVEDGSYRLHRTQIYALRKLLVPVGNESDEFAPVHEPVSVPVRRRDQLFELPRRDAEIRLKLDGLLQVEGVQPL